VKHILFIINPISGTRKFLKKRLPRLIERHIDRSKFTVEIRYTEYAGHASELARKAVDDHTDIVVIAGGDGSINEVANQLQQTDVVLGIFPVGSGNGLARHLGYNTINPLRTLHIINRLKTDTIDLCRFDGQVFCSNAGIGFVALVAKLFAGHAVRGFFSYAFSVFKGLFLFPRFPYSMQLNGQEINGEGFIISLCNSNQYGYNIRIAPDASLQDGLMDVWVLNRFPRWKAPFLFIRVLRGTHLRSKYFQHFTTARVEISTERPLYFQVDGETRDPVSHLNVTVVPRSLKVIVP